MHDFSAIARQISFEALQIQLPQADVEILARFVPVADALILKSSLRELRGAVRNGVPGNFMQRLHRVYNRKISDLSRVFPALHTFETSFRTFVCYMMQDIYGTDDWWRDFYAYALSLNTTSRKSMPSAIGQKAISSDMADALYKFAGTLVLDKEVTNLLQRESKGEIRLSDHQIIQFSTLKDLRELIFSDWLIAKNYLVSEKPLTQANFLEYFETVRTARNNLFHHRQVAASKNLTSHLIILLDAIGVHLPSSYDSVLHQAGRSISFTAPIEKYHLGLHPVSRSYTITYQSAEQDHAERVLSGTCESEVVMNFMYSEKAIRLERLSHMKVVLNQPSAPETTQT
ncbi:hypothetical protein CO665_29430 [Rhizobium anhuiense]|uniref:hypothetical protein n=1 Tax=Rhizobium anhuiense TaxID=1184720 RepID=UPI000BE8F53F|nr:hypothetical protein [Rhizobium anhuiense]PDS34678.1 hypothetical protein CO665_29430 [Rhizobium anhuiense]